MKIHVFLAQTETGYCAHSPDVPLVISAGRTFEDALDGYRECLDVLFDLIRKEGGEYPRPRTMTLKVDFVARQDP